MTGKSLLLLALAASPAFAGDLWEVASISRGPDETPLPHTQNTCFPENGMDPAQMLGGLGECRFEQKNGNANAMRFVMSCRTPGMPTGLDAMKVTGEARLQGDHFDMRYTVTVSGNQALPGGDFKLTGSVEARKLGHCNER